ncbi:MAG TPA: hypothetical protein VMQ11_12390 [Alphaproteobacteria bacterium]|nr:hypothetical protein [Alphaproteobacteria bacterium]
MSAKIIPFRTGSAVAEGSTDHVDASESPAQLQAAIERLEQLDRDLQLQAHKINLSLGEVRRKRLLLLKRMEAQRSA